MSKPERIGSIEISQDLEFQKKSWRVQRIAWKVMLAVAGAALIGLFGSGPLSSAKTGETESGVAARYERFIRAGGEHALTIVVTPSAVSSDSTAKIWIERDWLSGNLILAITPSPESEVVLPDRIIYNFRVAEPDSPIEVQFALEAKKAGLRQWRGGVDGDAPLSFRQLAYP